MLATSYVSIFSILSMFALSHVSIFSLLSVLALGYVSVFSLLSIFVKNKTIASCARHLAQTVPLRTVVRVTSGHFSKEYALGIFLKSDILGS